MATTRKKRPGFGPIQLATHVRLADWQIERGRTRGLVPAPALPSGRWSDEQAADLAERRDDVIEALGDHPGYGAGRATGMLADAFGLADEQIELWSCDIEDLAEHGMLDAVGEYKGHTLYDARQLASPTPEMGAALREIIATRRAWLEASERTREAAGRCGFEVAEFEQAARTAGITAGRFGRWALEDVERLAGNEELAEDVRAARLVGPELAAQHLEIRRRDFDYCVQAGWVAPVSSSLRRYGARREVEVPLYRVGDLDALLELPDVDWELVRATRPGRPSPLREFAALPSSRADNVHALAARIAERYSVPAWAHYHPGRDQWTLNWLPGPHSGNQCPTQTDVEQLLHDSGLSTADVTLLSGPIATVHWARAMLRPGRAVVLDTETTDLPGSVVEIAVLDCATGEVLLNTLVDPQSPVSEGARAVHGIADADVHGQPTFDQMLPDLLTATADRTVLAYNEAFDRECIVNDCRRLGLSAGHLGQLSTWDCLMERRSDWEGISRWLPLGGGHRALGDAQAALRLLHDLAQPPAWALPQAHPHRTQHESAQPTRQGRVTMAIKLRRATQRNPPDIR
ncbi:putative exonuclease (plasmid) [Actinacidiphila reveromycinica]|uniref:Putative exonuclease n=1 Tax=Actinacidiphila reveromycinica TaxID=659352 RepID=A0A7R6QCP2_9ACTN|nr:3'-5' exonuclease [Streptomyces sp. SN-593]BBG20748.1 putative exonuclease [Streptomyces sp. SN-593]